MLTKKTFLVLAALLCTTAVTACEETWRGMGRDTEEIGEEMQDPNR